MAGERNAVATIARGSLKILAVALFFAVVTVLSMCGPIGTALCLLIVAGIAAAGVWKAVHVRE